jgi:tRNA (mo5U34)-methyltransferase
MDELQQIKQEKWFYEFTLPDGTKTECYLPASVRKIHETREMALRKYLETIGERFSSGLDVSCHEGYFSLVLADYFKNVTGIDKNQDSLGKAIRIAKFLGHAEIAFENSSVENWPDGKGADFVLCYGLLYHVENPIQVLRKLSALTRKAIGIETHVLPFQISGPLEDGHYLWQRELTGMFGLCRDYSHSKEGGLTDVALVPSRDALVFLLKEFGFNTINFYQPVPDDYEQFVRRSRVIVFAEK